MAATLNRDEDGYEVETECEKLHKQDLRREKSDILREIKDQGEKTGKKGMVTIIRLTS